MEADHTLRWSWEWYLALVMMTIITVSYRYAIKLWSNYNVCIIIIPEGHPRQNGNEMAAMILAYPPMYCPNNRSCHLIPKYTAVRWLCHWFAFYKALQRFPQFTDAEETTVDNQNSADEDTDPGDPSTTESNVEYESLKAMADADHEVCDSTNFFTRALKINFIRPLN